MEERLSERLVRMSSISGRRAPEASPKDNWRRPVRRIPHTEENDEVITDRSEIGDGFSSSGRGGSRGDRSLIGLQRRSPASIVEAQVVGVVNRFRENDINVGQRTPGQQVKRLCIRDDTVEIRGWRQYIVNRLGV